jgi:tRNA-2-methylthio-N6-dimethylallyladenosine synthase
MVESRNEARSQWMGRTTQNKTLNFTAPDGAALETGRYVAVKVTTCFPNSLLGELAVIGG